MSIWKISWCDDRVSRCNCSMKLSLTEHSKCAQFFLFHTSTKDPQLVTFSITHDPPYAHRNICCTGCKCDVINVRYLMRWKICTNYGSYGCSGLWLPVGQGKCDVRGDRVHGDRTNGETGERWSFWANVRWRNLSDWRNRGNLSMLWKMACNATIHLPQSAAPRKPKMPEQSTAQGAWRGIARQKVIKRLQKHTYIKNDRKKTRKWSSGYVCACIQAKLSIFISQWSNSNENVPGYAVFEPQCAHIQLIKHCIWQLFRYPTSHWIAIMVVITLWYQWFYTDKPE